tara:strand:+ start:2550 stop:3068 length:519 start_codon:yes stop_codon:yes gene_type:complete
MKSYFIAIILNFGILQSYSQNTDTTCVIISSSNLSEDMRFSLTKDDELLLLVYQVTDTNKTLDKPLFLNRFNFNDSIKTKTFYWPHINLQDKKLVFYLIEIDSDKTSLAIDPIVRTYHFQLNKCFSQRDYTCIEKYLGDEDLLATNYFNLPSIINIKGIHKLDKYQYSIIFK